MKKLPDIQQFNKIAIIQTAFLGDIALALYLAEDIKKIHPICELTFVTTPVAAALVSCSKAIDSIITYDKRALHKGWKGIKDISDLLRQRKIDCILAPHRSLRTTLVSYMAKPAYSVGFDRNAFSFLYKKRIKYIQGNHEVERNAKLLHAFDTSQVPSINPRWGVSLEISDDDKNYIDNLMINHNLNDNAQIVAIAPGSVWETKRWLPEYFEKTIHDLMLSGLKPVIIGSKDDLSLADRIAGNTGCLSIAGKTSIPQLLYFMSKCRLTITNDSSPTHFAGLVRCPVLTIFGATIPEFGFAPIGATDRSLGLEGLKCRPCSIHGGRKCPIKTFDCMVNINPENVVKSALELITNY